VRLGKYLGCRLSLEAYLWIGNMILGDDLGLNLYVVSTVCYVVIISDNQREVRRGFLVGFLVDFQTEDYRVSIWSYILSL